MNDKEFRENLEKTRKQIDIASEIYLYALHTAEKIVDENFPHKAQIDLATRPNDKYERIMAREEAISVVLANLLQLSELIRV